ncbi:MAG: hypothetical protein KAY22_01730 [Rhizorhabdus sp.]|uniref:hypothetical protein n=1 Tax=Rhizorhabdus sp. TaxID=1968843 RepID=UPI001B6E508D|nr:hypothetical protein [Rhizorhabdus sp.]MBP8231000.1 hypothetical protein [Rhizorhabdus sp.]
MTDEHDDIGKSFRQILGNDERTDDERAEDQRKLDVRRNERAREAFERERDRRIDYLQMDQRIRNIASREVNKVVMVGVVFVGTYAFGRDYGWPAGAAFLIAIAALHWWDGRKAEKLPRFKIDEVDQLAEDTVTHERIVAYERDGKPWLWVKGQYLHWEGLFDHPFWDDVNRRVRTYAGMSHQKRVADNRAARAASLPFRKAVIARLREQDAEWELPSWARLDSDERA